MSEKIELEQLQTTGVDETFGVTPQASGDLRRLSAVPVELSVEIGRARMTVGETLDLRQGSIVTLNRMAGEPVDLLVNGTPIARGEVVVIDEQFGLRLTEVLGEPPAAESVDALSGAPAGALSEQMAPTPSVPEEPAVAEPVPAEPAQGQPVSEASADSQQTEPLSREAGDAAPAPA